MLANMVLARLRSVGGTRLGGEFEFVFGGRIADVEALGFGFGVDEDPVTEFAFAERDRESSTP